MLCSWAPCHARGAFILCAIVEPVPSFVLPDGSILSRMTIEGAKGPVAYQMCVILPVCDPFLQCNYGTDCRIAPPVK